MIETYYVEKAVIKAGILLHKAFLKEDIVLELKSDHTYVTQYDRQIEKVLFDELSVRYAKHNFFGEENFTLDTRKLDQFRGQKNWFIDPIDGTHNFQVGIPLCCIAIAWQYNDKTELGIIYNPIQNYLVMASLEERPTCNRRVITRSKIMNCKPTCITSCGSFSVLYSLASKDAIFSCFDCRLSLGSSALALAYTACSNNSIALITYTKYCHYDVLAGIFLVERSGGIVVNHEGVSPNLTEDQIIIAGPEQLVTQMLPHLSHYQDEICSKLTKRRNTC